VLRRFGVRDQLVDRFTSEELGQGRWLRVDSPMKAG
jgi:hypothetical protein